MLGRLLLVAVGAVAGVMGKMVYDERETSPSSGSAKEEPLKSKAEPSSEQRVNENGGHHESSSKSISTQECQINEGGEAGCLIFS